MRKVLFVCFLVSVGLIGSAQQSALKQQLFQRWEQTQAKLADAGLLEQVKSYRGDVNNLQIPEPLKSEVVSLWTDYRRFADDNRARNEYRAIFLELETEPNDTIGQANEFAFAQDGFEGDIPAKTADEDWFKFTLRDAETFTIINVTTNGDSITGDSYLELYDANGTLVASNDDYNFLGGAIDSRIFFAPNGGRDWYTRVTVSPFAPDDPDVALDDYRLYYAQPVGRAEFQLGVALNDGESATHKVNMDQGDKIDVTVFVDADPAVSDYDLDLYLFPPSNPGSVIASSESTEINFEHMVGDNVPETGEYTVQVDVWSLTGAPSPYYISLNASGAALPVLSPAGLVVFCALLALAGAWYMRKKRQADLTV